MSSYRNAVNEDEMRKIFGIRLKRKLTSEEFYIAAIARGIGEEQELKRISEKMIENIRYNKEEDEP